MGTARLLLCVLAFASISAQALPQEAPTRRKITITGKLTRVVAIGGGTSGLSPEFKDGKAGGGEKRQPGVDPGPPRKRRKLKDTATLPGGDGRPQTHRDSR